MILMGGGSLPGRCGGELMSYIGGWGLSEWLQLVVSFPLGLRKNKQKSNGLYGLNTDDTSYKFN